MYHPTWYPAQIPNRKNRAWYEVDVPPIFPKMHWEGKAAANARGEKLPVFVIDTTKSAYCFKNVKTSHVAIGIKIKVWMDSSLFEDWVQKIDRKFSNEEKKSLIANNCAKMA